MPGPWPPTCGPWVAQASPTGILTEPQFSVFIKALEQREGTELSRLNLKSTVISGRQAQCKATDIHSIVKGINDQALTPPGIHQHQ